jgi:glutamate-1-semialdehyde 2,1-aminomutase
VFGNGYHGSTLSFANGENPPTNLPHQFLIGTFNDIEATRPLLHYGIGAILVEPLQCAGGIVPATREFLQFLRKAANTLNAVLIFDEVVTSRLHYHGMQRYYDVTGIAGLKLLTPGEIERINTLGDRIRAGINERTQDGQLVNFKAIGFGSLIGLHFSGSMGDKLRNIFYYEMLKWGIVVGRRGFVMLNVMHEDTHVDQLLSAVSGFVNLIEKV